MSLPQLRAHLRAARTGLSPREQRAHAIAAARRILSEPRLRRATRIAFYQAADGELDPASLLALAPKTPRRWYLPVLRPHAAGQLWFVRYRPGDPLQPNRFGIPEPVHRGRDLHPLPALDLILMPLVGFDAQCNRLGMGGGYYDRSLAALRHRHRWHQPLLVGLAHECQRLDQLEPRPWDLPLDAVVTERGIQWRESPS